MQHHDSSLDDLKKVKIHLDMYYKSFVMEMEYAIGEAFAEAYEHIIINLADKENVLDAVSQQFALSEIHDKLALSLQYLFQRFSGKIVSESLDQIFENALVKARKKYESKFMHSIATKQTTFLSSYDPLSRFQLHLN